MADIILTRRRLFSLLPAPLIVSAFNIMPVSPLAVDEEQIVFPAFCDGMQEYVIRGRKVGDHFKITGIRHG